MLEVGDQNKACGIPALPEKVKLQDGPVRQSGTSESWSGADET